MANGDDKTEDRRESTSVSLKATEDRLSELREIGQDIDRESDQQAVEDFASPRATGDRETIIPRSDFESNRRQLERDFSYREDVQKELAASQGFLESTAKESIKLLPEIALTLGEYGGHFVDAGSWNTAYHGAEAVAKRIWGAPAESIQQSYEDADPEEMGNAFTESLRKARKGFDELELGGFSLETYRENPAATWDPTDPTWWTKHATELGRSVGAFALLGGAAGSALRAGAGAAASAAAPVTQVTGGGQMLRAGLQRAAQGMTSVGLAQTEGMAEAQAVYDQTRREAFQAQLEKGEPRAKAAKIADRAAGQAAATTAGITMAAIPALNYMSVMPAFRAADDLRNLSAAGLDRKTGELTKDWMQRATNAGLASNLPKQLYRTARESGFESLEEVTNQLAQVEGQYRGSQLTGEADPSTLGERIGERVLTSEGGLAATLGAIGGAGQQTLIRKIPMHQRVGEEGESEIVSQATLQSERRMERFQNMKDAIQKRGQAFLDFQEQLKKASQNGNEEQIRQAQERLLNTTINESYESGAEPESTGLIKSLGTGTEEEVRRMVENMRDMSDQEAEQAGFETNEDSPYHYEKLADEYLTHMKELDNAWSRYQNDFNWTQEEKQANLPAQLFDLEANIRSRARQEKRTEEYLDNLSTATEEFPESVQPESKDLGRIASEITRKRMRALERIAFDLQSKDSIPSEFDSLEELKNEVDFERIRATYKEEVQDVIEEEEITIPEPEKFNSALDRELEGDMLDAMDMVHQTYDNSEIMDETAGFLDIVQEEKVETENREYRTPTPSFEQKVLQSETRKQASTRKQKMYRDQLEYLETSQGRADYMQRIKERDAQQVSEDVQNKLDEISGLETISQVQTYRENISPNEPDAVKNALDMREEEIKTSQMETEPTGESDTATQEPTGPDTEPTPPGPTPDTGPAPPDPQSSGQEETRTQEEKRTQQQQDQEPTGSDTRTETEPVDPEPQESNLPGAEDTDPGGPVDTRESEPSDPQSGARSNIEQMAESAEDRMDNVAERELNNLIGKSPRPDDNDPNKPTVDEWVEEMKNQFDQKKGDLRARNERKPPQHSITPEQLDQIIEDKKDDLRKIGNSRAIGGGGQAISTEGDGEPTNVGVDQDSATDAFIQGENQPVEEPSPKIGDRHQVVNYRSRNFKEVEIDGQTMIVDTSNRRNANFDKRVETTRVSIGDRLRYEIDETVTEENIDRLVEEANIKVYDTESEQEIRIGSLPLPGNINANNTLRVHNGNSNNLEIQRARIKRRRRDILEAELNTDQDTELTGKIIEKRDGHLSISRQFDENGDPVIEDGVHQKNFRSLAEAFENDDLNLFVMKDGQPHITDSRATSVANNFNGQESMVEGSTGVVLPTPNGRDVAIPLHNPTIGEISGLSTILYNIISDEDLTPTQKANELEKYIFLKSGSLSDVYSNPQQTDRVRVRATDDGITIGVNNGGVKYSTNPQISSKSDGRPVSGNKTKIIRDLLSNMYLNVNLNKINQGKEIVPGKYDQEFLEQYDNYDDFIWNHLRTDILEDSVTDEHGQEHHIYFEQPTIKHAPQLDQTEDNGGPSRGNSTREQGEPINMSAEDVNVSQDAREHFETQPTNDAAQEYVHTTELANTALENEQWDLYNALRERAILIHEVLDEHDSHSKIDVDVLPVPPTSLSDLDVGPEVGGETEAQPEVDIEDTSEPVVEEGDVAFSAFNDTQEANADIVEGIAERVAAGEDLTDAEQAIREEYSDQIDEMVTEMTGVTEETAEETETEETQPESINEQAEDFEADNIDLSNRSDPQVDQMWRDMSYEEMLNNFQRLVEEDTHKQSGDDVLELLRDDIFENAEWRYKTMGGSDVVRELEKLVEQEPNNTPSSNDASQVSDDGAASDIADMMDDQTMGRPAGSSYDINSRVYTPTDMSPVAFEQMVEEMQNSNKLTITCKS